MTHLTSIIWLISWPILIYATYIASIYALKMLHKALEEEEK
jgi:hypothetical protein